MAKPLTLKALENFKPGRTRREAPDGLLPGLYFIVQPTGKRELGLPLQARRAIAQADAWPLSGD
jgi:hypothetical protein